MKALVVQNVSSEGPGLLGECLLRDGWEVDLVIMDRGDMLPPRINGYQFFLLLGGPMSANDGDKLPYLRQIEELIRQTISQEISFLGICLGAQLLARALGAKVYSGETPELGWNKIELTQAGLADPLFRGFSDTIEVFQLHGETFELPSGATLLAGSSLYPHQGFRFGSNAYGLQFHLEVTEEMALQWLKYWASDVELWLGKKGLENMVRWTPVKMHEFHRSGMLFWENFHKQCFAGKGAGATKQ